MNLPSISAARARDLVARFGSLRVLVAGDLMLDRFIIGEVTRISPEAPVPVVRFGSEYTRLGGAANVAQNLAALGARVALVGLIGADRAGAQLRADLRSAGIDDAHLVETPARPTVEKVRVATSRNQQVLRIDYEEDADISGSLEAQVVAAASAAADTAAALLVSDYLKGTVTRPLVEALLSRKTAARPLIVDPKIPHLGAYRGATLVTPNNSEAEVATHRRIRTTDDARDAALDFRQRAECEAVLITRGEHGMWLSAASEAGAVPAVAREVADVTGAGDTVAATLALALAAGASLAEAAVLANHAAGIVVGRFGPATLTPAELLAAVDLGVR